MNYFITDIKSMVRSTSFQLLFFVTADVIILDPKTMYYLLENSKGYWILLQCTLCWETPKDILKSSEQTFTVTGF